MFLENIHPRLDDQKNNSDSTTVQELLFYDLTQAQTCHAFSYQLGIEKLFFPTLLNQPRILARNANVPTTVIKKNFTQGHQRRIV
jgi:hypothetical protein